MHCFLGRAISSKPLVHFEEYFITKIFNIWCKWWKSVAASHNDSSCFFRIEFDLARRPLSCWTGTESSEECKLTWSADWSNLNSISNSSLVQSSLFETLKQRSSLAASIDDEKFNQSFLISHQSFLMAECLCHLTFVLLRFCCWLSKGGPWPANWKQIGTWESQSPSNFQSTHHKNVY